MHSRDFFRQNGAHFIVVIVVRTHYSGGYNLEVYLSHKNWFEFSCTPCTLLSIRLIHRFLLVKPDVWKLSILQHFNFISHKKSFLGQNDCKITHVHLKVHISWRNTKSTCLVAWIWHTIGKERKNNAMKMDNIIMPQWLELIGFVTFLFVWLLRRRYISSKKITKPLWTGGQNYNRYPSALASSILG